jgi:hypothetical protein
MYFIKYKKILYHSLILTILLWLISYYGITFNNTISYLSVGLGTLGIINFIKTIIILSLDDISAPLSMEGENSNEGPPQISGTTGRDIRSL